MRKVAEETIASNKRGHVTHLRILAYQYRREKNGEIHLGMLPFITPFELVKETIDKEEVTSLKYEDVNVNHNTIRPLMAY